MAPEKAAKRRSFHPEMEMKVGEEDLGHHGSNSSNSRRKEKWFCEEEMEWRRKKSKEKRNSQGTDPRTCEENSQGKDPRTFEVDSQGEGQSTFSTCVQCKEWWYEAKMVRHTLQGEQSEGRQHVKDERLWERWQDEGNKKGKCKKRRKVEEAEKGRPKEEEEEKRMQGVAVVEEEDQMEH